MRAAVVGAGIVGASAALSLARRGHDVTLLEQFPIGHRKGSSHGRTRIVRKAYPHRLYTRLMLDAYPLWRELESMSGKRLLHEVGLIYAGKKDAPDILTTIQALEENHVLFELLEGDSAAGFCLQVGEVAIHTPEAGFVLAESALRSTLELAVRHGVKIRIGIADPSTAFQEFDCVLVAAGSWVREWIDLPVKVTLQTFAYLEGRFDGPVWIEDGPALCYGFPSEPGQSTFKIGVHRAGRELDPRGENGAPSEEDLDAIRQTAERRFRRSMIVQAETCRYTSTGSEDFLIGRLGDNAFFASACSGHGFKFGPWTGRLLADFAEGAARPEDYPEIFHV